MSQPEGWTTLVISLARSLRINDEAELQATDMAGLSMLGRGLTILTQSDCKLLILSGAPIDEPVVGYGPFVMNSDEAIVQAIRDLTVASLEKYRDFGSIATGFLNYLA